MLASVAHAGRAPGEAVEVRRLVGPAIMVACGVASVLYAHGVAAKVAAGVLVAVAEAGLLVARRFPVQRPGLLAALGCITAGLAVMFVVTNGLGEVPVLAGTGILPRYLSAGRAQNLAVGAVSVAFGVTVWLISGNPIGLLAGVGAWALADRSIERAAFEAERDRALALLAEVEASRQTQLEAAAAEERNRIAREMHDVLAHSLAGLSMQLQAIRAVAAAEGAPASVTGPIDRAAELAREGVQEARAAVGALRAPQLHGPDDLPGLVAGFPGEAGLRVSGPAGRLSPEAGHAVYRAVQEAMTNSARYATGSVIDVEVTWGLAQLQVQVRDHGLPAGRQPSGVKGGGTGIASMAGRIEAVGGSLTAGPVPNGRGWLLQLTVPEGGGPGSTVGPDSPGNSNSKVDA
jgi:signal transduction histidine kinase